jgi:uncharacterized protein (TIGR00661 family)
LKILYGINTIGQGHLNRSSTVINQLIADGHQVDCVFSGPSPPNYALKIAHRWMHIHGYIMKFIGHRIDTAKTFCVNLKYARSLLKSISKIFRLTFNEKYDAIINDFDLITSLTGFLLRKPVTVIDHQHSLIHPGAVRAPGKISDIFNVIVAIGMTVPYFSHIFTLDFVEQPIRRHKETLFPLIWKHELKNLPISVEDHYCVYLPYIDPKHIYDVFSQFPNEKFFVYGQDLKNKNGNVIFKPTSRKTFLKDMASSKGVIAHSGFSMSWEIMLLRKPFYTIPLKKHYEQQTNAYRLSKLQLAHVANNLTREELAKFIKEAEDQNYEAPVKFKIYDASVLTKFIYEAIERYS